MQLRLSRCLGLLLLASAGCADTPSGPTQPIGAGSTGAQAGAAPPLSGSGVQPSTSGSQAPAPTGGIGSANSGSGAGGSGAPPQPAGTSGGVPSVMGERGNWASFGGDLANTRASASEKMISAANAAMLKPAINLKAPGVTATPALYKGVIYWSDWGGIVHATKLEDQSKVWELDRSAMGGGYTGSPAVTERFVYVANRNGLLTAIDRETGVAVWEKTLDAGPHTHIWSSPVVAEQDDVLILGVAGLGTRADGFPISSSQLASFRGWVQGVDATTGELLWRFDVTPEPSGAGGSVWSSAAIDLTRKLAFIGTGNNYYTPVSQYTDSLVALDYMTGQRKWHVQFTMNDAWTTGTPLSGVDGDVGAAPNLFAIDGRDVVGVGDKPGSYHVHDRVTGEEIWKKKLTDGSGFQGGVMAPAAYQDGVIYVVSNNGTRSSTAFALQARDGMILWETDLTDPTFGGPAVGNGVLYVGDQAGNVWGLDTKTGDELWKPQRLPAGRGGGFSLVDGMLFTGYGFHFSEPRREPLMGGLMAFSLTGLITAPPPPEMPDDCVPNTALTTAPTFGNVYQGVLCPSGCTRVCHSSSAEAGLRLDRVPIAHQSLVGVAAKGEACRTGGHMLVVAGNPTASLLHGKLALAPPCGTAMPPNVTAATTPITPAMLEVVRGWITAGAPLN